VTFAGVVVLLAVLVAAACTDDGARSDGAARTTDTTADTTAAPSATSGGPTTADAPSLVVIGDSVAAGEGIADGYRYDLDRRRPDDSVWVGGTTDPAWLEPYPLCHQTDQAYGHLVAARVGARLASFACTGATYLNGVTAAQVEEGRTYRPAQFGDWAARRDLNADYDRAEPDVVVITLGADDVSFSSIVRFCVGGFTTGEATQVGTMLAADDPAQAIADAVAARAGLIARAIETEDLSLRADVDQGWCTAANPGPVIDQLFWEPVRSGELARHYRELVAAVRERGADPAFGDGDVPEIVLTTYHHPLPPGADGDCWDVFPLSDAEQSYLQSLQDTLQRTLEDAVRGLEGVTVADLSATMDGREWCSDDPWTYGLSIIWFDDPQSMAPFHPTPEGQASIARVVAPAVQQALERRASGGTGGPSR
jgi:lysophospholipase L1-like esterase